MTFDSASGSENPYCWADAVPGERVNEPEASDLLRKAEVQAWAGEEGQEGEGAAVAAQGRGLQCTG